MGFVNLKTRTKLLLSFFIVLVITGVVGVNRLMNANAIKNNLDAVYKDCFIHNMLLGKMQMNQSSAESEMLRILWKSDALKDLSVVKTSEEG